MSNDKAHEVQKSSGEGTAGAISDFVSETTKPGATNNSLSGSATKDVGASSKTGVLDFSANDPLSLSKVGNVRTADAGSPSAAGAEAINKAMASFNSEKPLSESARQYNELTKAYEQNRAPKLSDTALRAEDAKVVFKLLGKDSATKDDLEGLLKSDKLKADPNYPRADSETLNNRDRVQKLLNNFDSKSVAELKEKGALTKDRVNESGKIPEERDNAKYAITRALREKNPKRAINDPSLTNVVDDSCSQIGPDGKPMGPDGVADILQKLQDDLRVSGRKLDADGNEHGMTLRILDVPSTQPSASEAKAAGFRWDENHNGFVRTLAEKKFDFDIMGQ